MSCKEAVFNGFHILLDHLASSLIYQLESTKVYQSLPKSYSTNRFEEVVLYSTCHVNTNVLISARVWYRPPQ